MKPVLCIQNITLEKLGTMEMFFVKRNISYTVRDLYIGESVPSDPSDYGAVVVLGGPMSVNEEERYPFLREEKRLLNQCREKQIPILGICLGSQLLASAAGATVRKNGCLEIGWMQVELTEAGKNNSLFQGIASPISVFQWHGETFELPNQSQWLATSPLCRNQAFSLEGRYFGLQFHLEVTQTIAEEWVEEYLNELNDEDKQKAMRLREVPDEVSALAAAQTADRVFENFFVQIAGYR